MKIKKKILSIIVVLLIILCCLAVNDAHEIKDGRVKEDSFMSDSA